MQKMVWGVVVIVFLVLIVSVNAIPIVKIRTNTTNNTIFFEGHDAGHYLNAYVGLFVNRTGDTMSGDLNISIGSAFVNMSAEDGGISITGNLTAGTGLGSVNIIDGRIGFITDTPDYMIDMQSGSIGNIITIQSGVGTMQALRLLATGGMTFIVDSDDDNSDSSFIWYEDDELLANRVMTLRAGSSHLTVGNGTSGRLSVRGNASFYRGGDDFVNISGMYGDINRTQIELRVC